MVGSGPTAARAAGDRSGGAAHHACRQRASIRRQRGHRRASLHLRLTLWPLSRIGDRPRLCAGLDWRRGVSWRHHVRTLWAARALVLASDEAGGDGLNQPSADEAPEVGSPGIFAEKISTVAGAIEAMNRLPDPHPTMRALLFSPASRHAHRVGPFSGGALLFAERLFRRRGRNWRYAKIGFIAASDAVPASTPVRPDRRHRGRQLAGCGRLGQSAPVIERHPQPAAMGYAPASTSRA